MLVSSAATPTTANAAPAATSTSQRVPSRRRRGGGGGGGGASCGAVMRVATSSSWLLLSVFIRVPLSSYPRPVHHRTQCPTYLWQRMQEIGSPEDAACTAGGGPGCCETAPGPWSIASVISVWQWRQAASVTRRLPAVIRSGSG